MRQKEANTQKTTEDIVDSVLRFVLATRGNKWQTSRVWYVSGPSPTLDLSATKKRLHRQWKRVDISKGTDFLPEAGGYTIVRVAEITLLPNNSASAFVRVQHVGEYDYKSHRRGYNLWEWVTIQLIKRNATWQMLGLKDSWKQSD